MSCLFSVIPLVACRSRWRVIGEVAEACHCLPDLQRPLSSW